MNLQERAKGNSEAFLKERGVFVNPNFPFIEETSELQPQDAQSVARRCLVLGYVIGTGFGQPGRKLKEKLVEYGLYDYASTEEKGLLEKDELATQVFFCKSDFRLELKVGCFSFFG